MPKVLEIYTDGACSGNPGAASIGVVIYENGEKIKEISKAIGDATNNIAEYTALIYALQEALILKADQLNVFTDSELMHRQVTGQYKVKNPNIQLLFDQVQHLLKGFEKVSINHILREKNKEADRLATNAIKNNRVKTVASLFDDKGEESPSSEG